VAGFSFDTSSFESPKVMQTKLKRAVMANMRYWDGPVEEHMKHNAPWTDRTTNARNGLFAKAAKLGGDIWGIIVAHSVDYGVYLELGHEHSVNTKDGGTSTWTVAPRPIIQPTIALYGPKVIGTLTRILDRLG
jgi:hypothetical protein